MPRAQTLSIDVKFKFTDIDYNPLPGETIRVVFGAGPDWQSPTAGHKFVTDEKGEARFITEGPVDKRWRMKPYAMTGLSFPERTEHMLIAAELEHKLPLEKSVGWLLTMDLDCRPGECATKKFTGLYKPDANGRFTQRAQGVPACYEPWDFLMTPDPADPARKRRLQLAFKRLPSPVWR